MGLVPDSKAAPAGFCRSNTFGAIKGSGWTGPGVHASLPDDRQDLAQLILNGRERPGLNGYSAQYTALATLKRVWLEHGATDPDNFYDQYYLPAEQSATGLMLGRSPMPVVKSHDQATFTLFIFGDGDTAVRMHCKKCRVNLAAGR